LPMKVRLITNFSFLTADQGEFHVPISVEKISDLLTHIGKQIEFLFMDVTGKTLRKDVEIVLNGKNIWFYPRGLEMPLKEGDCIDITLTPLGGG
jgi:molybdopterin converting factor small subunit